MEEIAGSERLSLLAEKQCKARICFEKRKPVMAHFFAPTFFVLFFAMATLIG